MRRSQFCFPTISASVVWHVEFFDAQINFFGEASPDHHHARRTITCADNAPTLGIAIFFPSVLTALN